jgi:hypothetical protein
MSKGCFRLVLDLSPVIFLAFCIIVTLFFIVGFPR